LAAWWTIRQSTQGSGKKGCATHDSVDASADPRMMAAPSATPLTLGQEWSGAGLIVANGGLDPSEKFGVLSEIRLQSAVEAFRGRKLGGS
jgi:hypothetical protein